MKSQQLWLVACLGMLLSACQLINPSDDIQPYQDVIELHLGDHVHLDEQNVATQALINSGLRFSNPSTSFEALNNICYLSTTYIVDNNTGANLANLSLVALNRADSVGGTAIRGLRGAAGNPVTDPAIYRSIQPGNRVIAIGNSPQVVAGAADFQVFLTAEVANLQADVTALAADARVLEYGYVVRNMEGGRILRDGETGTVTIAV
ncbi:MAG: hypothetical protein AAF708_15990, partial [Deinococcota bacterium]